MVAAAATATAVARLELATTAAVGCLFAISRARLGPLTTAMRSGSTSSSEAMTSLMRRPVPRSTPFMRLTIGTSGGTMSLIEWRLERSDWLGTER